MVESAICYAANDGPIYDAAIEKLANYRERIEVESAISGFAEIKSNYGNASLFRMYAEAILNIHEDEFEQAIKILELLSKNSAFVEQLNQYIDVYYYPSCDDLITYARARICEEQQDYINARSLYESITGVWDSVSRYLVVDNNVNEYLEEEYQRAKQLFDDGNYVDAAAIFAKLGAYKDSEEQYEASMIPLREADARAQEEARLAEMNSRFNGGVKMFEQGNYSDASSIFADLMNEGYPESERWYNDSVAELEKQEETINSEREGDRAEKQKYAVTTAKDKLHLWTGPNADKYVEIFTQTASLDYVAIEKEFYPEKDLWYALIEWQKDGKRWRGYVSQTHLDSIDEIPEAKHFKRTEVLDNDYDVYLAPSKSKGVSADVLNNYDWSSSYGRLKAGTIVTFLEYDGNDGNYWYVEYYNDKIGKPERGYIKNSNAAHINSVDPVFDLGNYVDSMVSVPDDKLLVMQTMPNGGFLPVKYRNGDIIIIHKDYYNDGFLMAYSPGFGMFGYVNAVYVNEG